MAKAFSVLSRNVEHFGATDKEHRRFVKDPGPIVDLVRNRTPTLSEYTR